MIARLGFGFGAILAAGCSIYLATQERYPGAIYFCVLGALGWIIATGEVEDTINV